MKTKTHTVVYYKKNGSEYYKIHPILKRITKIINNEVSYLDYDENYNIIMSYKSINMPTWKNIENNFFISRHFKWMFNGVYYTTTDKQIEWKSDAHGYYSSIIFHNGKIWNIDGGNGSDRFYLTSLDGKKNKWTDIKYCRHFEIDKRITKIKKLL